MDRKSEVYVTQEDKEKLSLYIEKIKQITDKYPYSNDYSNHFATTISRIKGDVAELHEWIGYLDVR